MLIHRKQHLAVRLIRVFPLAWLKVHGSYISFPWFRFTHMDLALRVLLNRFQIIFDRIRLKKCITAVFTVNIPKPRRSCSWIYKINKLLVSLNERLNNIILDIILLSLKIPRQKNPMLPLSSRHICGKKGQSSHGLLTCSHVRHKLSHVSVTVPV